MSLPFDEDRIKKLRAFIQRVKAEQEAYKEFLFDHSELIEILFDHADLLEDLIAQVNSIPNERWVQTDPIHGVVFIQNEKPYQPETRGKLAALLVMVLNEERRRTPDRYRREPVAIPTLVRLMKARHIQIFKKKGRISPRTVERVVSEIRNSDHFLGQCVVSVEGSLGGYYLDTAALPCCG